MILNAKEPETSRPIWSASSQNRPEYRQMEIYVGHRNSKLGIHILCGGKKKEHQVYHPKDMMKLYIQYLILINKNSSLPKSSNRLQLQP
jgi:hypothetical protein